MKLGFGIKNGIQNIRSKSNLISSILSFREGSSVETMFI